MRTFAQQIQAAGLGVFPCHPDESPAVPPGTDWREQAFLPAVRRLWRTGLVGVPVPPGVVVLALDVRDHGAVNRRQLTQWQLTYRHPEGPVGFPWEDALIQSQEGFEYYAFAVDWPVRQASDFYKLKDLSTQVAGQGYICTGGPGYKAHGPAGVFRLAHRPSLPRLPEAARAMLGVKS